MKTVIVYGMNNVIGGIEKYLLSLYNCVNEDIKFVFFVENVTTPNEFIYKNEIEKKGGAYEFIPEHHAIRDYTKTLKKLLLQYKNSCKTVYVNFNNISLDIIVIELALSLDYKVVTHSHNAMQEPIKRWQNRVRNTLLRRLGMLRLSRLNIVRLAVSQLAGEYMYGNRPFRIVSPGIDVSKFSFDEKSRDRIRGQYGMQKSVVLGFVGRIVAVKNPIFLVDILNEAKKVLPEVKLLMVGDGIMRDEMIAKAQSLGIEKDILFVGAVDNVQDYLQAMDVLVAPSLSEGMPLVIMEAQSVGVPCICAKGNIPKQVDVTGMVEFCNLSEGAPQWVEMIKILISKKDNRDEMHAKVQECEYNINNSASKLLQIIG